MINIIDSSTFTESSGNFFYKAEDRSVLKLEKVIRDNFPHQIVPIEKVNQTVKYYLFFSINNPDEYTKFNSVLFLSKIKDSPNLHVCINFPMECYVPFGVQHLFDFLLGNYKLSKFFFSYANALHIKLETFPTIQNRKNDFCSTDDWARVKCIPHPLFEMHYVNHMLVSRRTVPKKLSVIKKFLMPVRTAKPYRIMFYLWCRDNDILTNSYYSWLAESSHSALVRCEQLDVNHTLTQWRYLDQADIDCVNTIVPLDPTDRRPILQKQWDMQDYQIANSFMQIVVETTFDSPSNRKGNILFITEKTYKAIFYKQPFILLSEVNSLAYLRSLGYRTFSDIIDEQYDTETNPHRRIHLICEQIKYINNLSLPEIEQLRLKINDVVEHNHRVLMSTPSKQILLDNLTNILLND